MLHVVCFCGVVCELNIRMTKEKSKTTWTASFDGRPNAQGIRWFMKEGMPKLYFRKFGVVLCLKKVWMSLISAPSEILMSGEEVFATTAINTFMSGADAKVQQIYIYYNNFIWFNCPEMYFKIQPVALNISLLFLNILFHVSYNILYIDPRICCNIYVTYYILDSYRKTEIQHVCNSEMYILFLSHNRSALTQMLPN